MRNIFLVALNSLRVTFRKKRNIIVYLLLPVALSAAILAVSGGLSTDNIRIGILNKDNGVLSTDMIKAIESRKNFKVTPIKEDEISSAVSTQKVDCVLVIPEGFSQGIYSNSPKEINLISIKGEEVTEWIRSYTNYYTNDLLDIAKASKGNMDMFDQIYQGYRNNGISVKIENLQDTSVGKSAALTSFGFLLMFILLAANTAAGLILKEKRNRTYFRICSAPVSSRDYIIGNVLANLAMVLVQIFLVIMVITKILKINIGIPTIEILAILMSFGVVAIGFGMLLVAFSNSTSQANSMTTLIITPTCMLGGCFWPVSVMPKALQRVADFMPQKWVLESIQKLQTGDTFTQVMPYVSVILAFAITFFLIAIYKFSRSNSVKNFI